MVEQEKFRLDLYYRLKVIPIHVPALRERKECILPLIQHYITYFCEKCGTQKRLTRAASDALLKYPYPGNVRELMNICERIVVMSESELIEVQDLPGDVVGRDDNSNLNLLDWQDGKTLQEILDEVEKNVLTEALGRCGNQYKVANALGLSQPTVNRRLRKYGISTLKEVAV